MGERWLKAEEEVIRTDYPTGARAELLELIPDRTWGQIGVHARTMGVHRTSETWGNSVREGRKALRDSWSVEENMQLIKYYPRFTRAEICAALPCRSWKAIRTHARRIDVARTCEAKVREIQIGRRNAKRKR